jgi:hypothetical protein
MQWEDDEAGSLVVGVRIESHVHKAVHTVMQQDRRIKGPPSHNLTPRIPPIPQMTD